MEPLVVEYTRSLNAAMYAARRDAFIISSFFIIRALKDLLRDRIAQGIINHVILVGPTVTTGWRIKTERAVRFETKEPESPETIQARARIVQIAGIREAQK